MICLTSFNKFADSNYFSLHNYHTYYLVTNNFDLENNIYKVLIAVNCFVLYNLMLIICSKSNFMLLPIQVFMNAVIQDYMY